MLNLRIRRPLSNGLLYVGIPSPGISFTSPGRMGDDSQVTKRLSEGLREKHTHDTAATRDQRDRGGYLA